MNKDKIVSINQAFKEDSEKPESSILTHKPKDLLESLDSFISNCENELSLEGTIEISYSQANYIRNLILLDEKSINLSFDTLKRAREFSKKLKEKK